MSKQLEDKVSIQLLEHSLYHHLAIMVLMTCSGCQIPGVLVMHAGSIKRSNNTLLVVYVGAYEYAEHTPSQYL